MTGARSTNRAMADGRPPGNRLVINKVTGCLDAARRINLDFAQFLPKTEWRLSGTRQGTVLASLRLYNLLNLSKNHLTMLKFLWHLSRPLVGHHLWFVTAVWSGKSDLRVNIRNDN